MRFRQWLRTELLYAVLFFGPMLILAWLTPMTVRLRSMIIVTLIFIAWRISENLLANYRARNREVENEQRFRRDTY